MDVLHLLGWRGGRLGLVSERRRQEVVGLYVLVTIVGDMMESERGSVHSSMREVHGRVFKYSNGTPS